MGISTIESITCDFCKKELICDTPYPARYAFKVSGIDVNRNSSGVTYAVSIAPPETLVFCGRACIAGWATSINKD